VPEVPLGLAAWSVALFAGDLAETETVARLLTEPNRSSDVRAVGHVWLAHVQLGGGRWNAAKRELENAEDLAAPSFVLYYRVVLSLLPFLKVSNAELTDLLEAVSALPSEPRPNVSSLSTLFSGHRGVEPFVKSYLAGLLSSRLGRRDLTNESADELERLGGIPEARTLGIDLGRAVQGHDAWFSGQTEPALEHFEAMPMEGLYTLTTSSGFYSHVFARFLRAESLKAMGRDEEAIRWYASLVWTSPYELVYRAPSHLGRAEIYDRAGDTELAAEHYARFVELWEDADPEFQPMVEEARQAIIRLEGLRRE
jgi:tetratricopeptide (TPR) repeat protein